jgi:hypothetical protein
VLPDAPHGAGDHDQALADVALRHLKNFTPLIRDRSQVLPSVVVSELGAENEITIDASVAEEAVESQKQARSQPPSTDVDNSLG